jgi:hypothetical protein
MITVSDLYCAHYWSLEYTLADSFPHSQKFGKLKKEAEKLQQLETPKKGTAVDTKSTGTGTKRKREKNAEANKETPSKPRKKSMTAVNPGDLAAEDDGEFKEQVKMEIDEDEEMEDEGRNAEEA